jgi:hypothetical protein
VSYELLALPVPPGAAIEEAGEALEVRLAGDHVFRDSSESGAARRRALAAVVAGAEPSLAEREDASSDRLTLATADGLSVEIDPAFVVFRVAYARDPDAVEAAPDLFDRLFRVVGAVVRETGWRVYDPQEASSVSTGDAGRDATLEIYLSVIDQLPAGNGVRPR